MENKLEISMPKVAETLKTQAKMFNCSYETAWEQWMHPLLTENCSFDEVMEYIKNN